MSLDVEQWCSLVFTQGLNTCVNTCVHVTILLNTLVITKPLQTQRNRPAHRLATDPKLAAATSGTLCNSRRHCATLFAGQTNKANQQHKQC